MNCLFDNENQTAKNKEGTEGDVSSDIEQGRIELPDRATTSSNDLSPSLSNTTLVQDMTGKVDESDEQDSMVKVVWSIRDCKELSFYLDYVHHLVKSQEQLNQHFYQRGVPRRILLSEDVIRNRRNHNMEGGKESDHDHGGSEKQRNAVEVEIYLTGLGNRSDPVYMLSQALFLLSIANKSSSYMKINFGRPELKKIVSDFKPDEVYYCGGSALKDNLQKVCNDSHIPFHPEDFDAGGGEVVKAIYKIATKMLPSFLFPADNRPRGNSQGGGKGKGSGRQTQTGKAGMRVRLIKGRERRCQNHNNLYQVNHLPLYCIRKKGKRMC